jgi:hypothetical protein
MGIKEEKSTVFVNKLVEKWAASSLNTLISLYFWQFAQIFGDYKMPAVSKRGVLVGLSRAGAGEL